jgi:hypothetical protein
MSEHTTIIELISYMKNYLYNMLSVYWNIYIFSECYKYMNEETFMWVTDFFKYALKNDDEDAKYSVLCYTNINN